MAVSENPRQGGPHALRWRGEGGLGESDSDLPSIPTIIGKHTMESGGKKFCMGFCGELATQEPHKKGGPR